MERNWFFAEKKADDSSAFENGAQEHRACENKAFVNKAQEHRTCENKSLINEASESITIPGDSSGKGSAGAADRLSGGPYTEDGRFLKNPLPVPRRRGHVQMEFDLPDAGDDWDLPEDREYFDIEIEDDDDFDL